MNKQLTVTNNEHVQIRDILMATEVSTLVRVSDGRDAGSCYNTWGDAEVNLEGIELDAYDNVIRVVVESNDSKVTRVDGWGFNDLGTTEVYEKDIHLESLEFKRIKQHFTVGGVSFNCRSIVQLTNGREPVYMEVFSVDAEITDWRFGYTRPARPPMKENGEVKRVKQIDITTGQEAEVDRRSRLPLAERTHFDKEMQERKDYYNSLVASGEYEEMITLEHFMVRQQDSYFKNRESESSRAERRRVEPKVEPVQPTSPPRLVDTIEAGLVSKQYTGSLITVEEGERVQQERVERINTTDSTIKVWKSTTDATLYEAGDKADVEGDLDDLLGADHGYKPKNRALTTITVEHFTRARLTDLIGSSSDSEDAPSATRDKYNLLRKWLTKLENAANSGMKRVRLVTKQTVELTDLDISGSKQLHVESSSEIFTSCKLMRLSVSPGYTYDSGGITVNYKYYRSATSPATIFSSKDGKCSSITSDENSIVAEAKLVIVENGEERTIPWSDFESNGFYTTESDAKGEGKAAKEAEEKAEKKEQEAAKEAERMRLEKKKDDKEAEEKAEKKEKEEQNEALRQIAELKKEIKEAEEKAERMRLEEKKDRKEAEEKAEQKKEKKKAKKAKKKELQRQREIGAKEEKEKAKRARTEESRHYREERRRDQLAYSSVHERKVKTKAAKQKAKRDGSSWMRMALVATGVVAIGGAIGMIGKVVSSFLSWLF